MPLTKLQIAPGIDKQNTEYGAEGRWVDSDNVRFRYGLPEKIGGWDKVTSDALLGATRAILTWSDLKGVNYAIYGTNKSYTLIQKEATVTSRLRARQEPRRNLQQHPDQQP